MSASSCGKSASAGLAVVSVPSGLAFAPGFPGGLARALLSFFLSTGLSTGLSDRGLADRDAIVEAEHDDDDIGLFRSEDAFCRGGPVRGLTLRLVLNESGRGLVFPDHAHVGLFGVGVFQSGGQPVGHAVADYQHVVFGDRLPLGCRRRSRKVLARGRYGLPSLQARLRYALLERPVRVIAKPATTEPATAALRLRPLLKSAEIEKLRRCRFATKQDSGRDCQSNQRTS